MNKLIIFIPLLISLLTTLLCPMGKDAGKDVKFRPPSYVFGIVWTVLYLCIGYSWYTALESDNNSTLVNAIYIGIIFSLFLWVYVYSCMKNKKASTWVFILINTLILMSFFVGNQTSKLLMCPLLAWSMFAMIMNTTQVQNQKE